MAAPTAYYIDPAIAANSGSGTIGDPYGDVQYALNTVTRDATNGDVFHVKAGTAEVLAATLSLATYGTPTAAAPLCFAGYTSTAGDGGIGEISGAGTYPIFNSSTLDYIHFTDMKLGNTGSAQLIRLDDGCIFTRVWFHTCSAGNVVRADASEFISCRWSGITGSGAVFLQLRNGRVSRSYFDMGTTNGWGVFHEFGGQPIVEFNRFLMGHVSAKAVVTDGSADQGIIRNNSVFNSAAGTTSAFDLAGLHWHVVNNLVEGQSGAGGVGIAVTGMVLHYSGNGFYNCTTTKSGAATLTDEDNESLGSSPFADAAAGDFTPVNVGNVLAGAWPTSIPGP